MAFLRSCHEFVSDHPIRVAASVEAVYEPWGVWILWARLCNMHRVPRLDDTSLFKDVWSPVQRWPRNDEVHSNWWETQLNQSARVWFWSPGWSHNGSSHDSKWRSYRPGKPFLRCNICKGSSLLPSGWQNFAQMLVLDSLWRILDLARQKTRLNQIKLR